MGSETTVSVFVIQSAIRTVLNIFKSLSNNKNVQLENYDRSYTDLIWFTYGNTHTLLNFPSHLVSLVGDGSSHLILEQISIPENLFTPGKIYRLRILE